MGNRVPARGLGFSLLEVLIALAIFSIGTLALIPLFGAASSGTRGGRELTTATTLARTYVDKLRNTPFNNIGPCAAPCAPPAGEVKDPGYTVSWTVSAADGSAYNFATPPSPNLKRITVTVTRACSDCPGGQRTVRMATLVSERS